jgi:hypothetical protein
MRQHVHLLREDLPHPSRLRLRREMNRGTD